MEERILATVAGSSPAAGPCPAKGGSPSAGGGPYLERRGSDGPLGDDDEERCVAARVNAAVGVVGASDRGGTEVAVAVGDNDAGG